MNQFYMSLIFMGIVLIMISFIGILYDRKRAIDQADRIEAKKQELEDALNDAEIMIQEMNKLSDYIVTQIENKYKELDNINSSENEDGQKNEDTNPIAESISLQSEEQLSETEAEEAPAEEVMPVIKNSRHNEVIILSKSGLNTTEIAKKLNMGQGEIQLILEMNK